MIERPLFLSNNQNQNQTFSLSLIPIFNPIFLLLSHICHILFFDRLVVPVLRNTENMNFSKIESSIKHYALQVLLFGVKLISLSHVFYHLINHFHLISFLISSLLSSSHLPSHLSSLYQAKEGSLALEDMMGGTFTISNGGVFGSMMGL